MKGNAMEAKQAIRTLRSDLSPIWNRDETLEDWEGCAMFEAPYQIDTDKLEEIAQTFVEAWAHVHEWTVEIICTGLFRLTPREWVQKDLRDDKECPSCKRGDGGKCVC